MRSNPTETSSRWRWAAPLLVLTALVAGLVAIPALSQADAANLNPDLALGCDMNVVLLLDGSESLGDSDLDPGGYFLPKVHESAAAFVGALADSNISVGIAMYATRASVLLPVTEVTSSSILPGGAHSAALNAYVATAQLDDREGGLGTYTNWEDGLLKAHTALSDAPRGDATATLLVHLTDGAPSAWSDPEGTGPADEDIADGISAGYVNRYTIEAAEAVADIVQLDGTHITTVGVGKGVDSVLYQAYMSRASGNDLVEAPYEDIDVSATDVVVTDFVLLLQTMEQIGLGLCPDGPQVNGESGGDQVAAVELSIEKELLTPQVKMGEDATFQITVRNRGGEVLGDVVVADPLAPGCDQTLPVLYPDDPDTAEDEGVYSYTCQLLNVRLGTGSLATAMATDLAGNTVGPVESS